MGIFNRNKKTPEPVAKYTEPEAKPPPAPKLTVENMLEKSLQNDVTITSNQQTILNVITALSQRIEQLAGEAPQEEQQEEQPGEQEEEYTDEELREAALALRKQKAPVPKTTIKKR